MKKSLTDLDNVLNLLVANDKKNQETYPEEIAELIKAEIADGYFDKIIQKLLNLGYVEMNADTRNYKLTLDGKIFHEGSKNGKAFSSQNSAQEIGSSKGVVAGFAVKKDNLRFLWLTIGVLIAINITSLYFIYSDNEEITSLQDENRKNRLAIEHLREKNSEFQAQISQKAERTEKRVNKHDTRINNVFYRLKQLETPKEE